MEVKAQCRKLFTGRLDVKENSVCSTEIIDRFEFESKFQYDQCGMLKDTVNLQTKNFDFQD